MNVTGNRITRLPTTLPPIEPEGKTKNIGKKTLTQTGFSASAGLLAIKETASFPSCTIKEDQNLKLQSVRNLVPTQQKNLALIGSFETEEHGYLVYKYELTPISRGCVAGFAQCNKPDIHEG
ncbi:hypothetical protein BJX63DRAFT_154640 [Aspergillus granulosus]|uniref:Uncharacterized protein n=1 Tax=Aspergillus granulosus TaxID=176169 RepID=A0ABR4GRQ1_9EURO